MNRLLRRTLYAGSAACCGAILWGASQASAAGNEEPVDQAQQVLIGNSTDQGADASILNRQININLPVAVLAPGANAGDVTQSNTASNSATASNTNRTTHTVDQAQDASSSGGGGVDQEQSADVSNQTSQSAAAEVDNRQLNVDLPVAVLSPQANVGDVTQSNEASNDASATNRNVTDQAVAQEQAADVASSTGHGPAGPAAVSQDQAADVANATSQEAQAPVTNEQSNEAAAAPSEPVAHAEDDGCGCDHPTPPPAPPAGDVTQSNEATNVALADNTNRTDQQVGQQQAAEAAGPKGATVSQDQSADVANATDQSAAAPVDNRQTNAVADDHGKDTGHGKGKGKGPHGPVPIPGDVTQANTATNVAAAANANTTAQSVAQGQAASVVAHGPKGHGPKDHGPKDHGPKGHGPKGHGPKHDECTPAPRAPAPCPR